MEGIVRMASDHPLFAMVVCFAVLIIVYVLFRSLFKFALILIIVAVAIGGYFYFQYPESRPANFKEAMDQVKTGVGKAVDQGKQVYEKGSELVEQGKQTYDKGKELVERGKTVLDKGIDKGKETVEKGKDTAGEIGKILRGDKEPGENRLK